MFTSLSHTLRRGGFAVLAGVAVVAGAQEAALDFIVTAGRTPEASADAPAHVTVISAADIARSGAATLVQVLERVAGVSFMPALAGAGTEKIAMRGFGENSFGRVLVLVDGVRLNNPDMKAINWNAVALSDVERVEVLDGSASVLYGNNAVAGVVNIITKKGGNGTIVSGSVGTFDTNTQRLSHRRSGDQGELTIAAEHVGTTGYRERQAAQTVNASIRGTVYPADTLSVTAQASLADLSYQLPGDLTEAQFEDDPTLAKNYADEGAEHHYTAGLSAAWAPSETLQAELPLSYIYKSITADMASYWVPSYTDRIVQTAEARPTLTADLRAGPLPVRLVGGFDLYGAFLDLHSYSDKARTTASNTYEITEWSVGSYLSARADLGVGLSATGGVRYDTAAIAAVNMDESVDEDIRHDAVVYDAGLVWNPAPEVKVYAKYGTLFRYPFTDEQAETSGYGTDQFNSELKPETGFNVEAGLALDVGRTLHFSGNGYYLHLEDEIALNASYHNENLDSTRRTGANLTLSARPLDGIEVTAGYAWVQAVFADGDNEGKRVPLVSEHGLEGSVEVGLPAGFSVAATLNYQGDAFAGGDNANALDKIDAYQVLGARVRWESGEPGRGLSVLAVINNLLDAEYAPLVFFGGYYPAEGRSVSVSVEYRY